jgi:hypothetical protein
MKKRPRKKIIRAQATLKKERGVRVCQGARGAKRSTESLRDLVDAMRKDRIRELAKFAM